MDTSKIKSFWEKPEGTGGMVLIGTAAIVGGMAILSHLDQLIKLAENTLYFGFLLGTIGAITALLLNERFRFMCGTAFQSIARLLTSIFIAIDAIGILKNYLVQMRKKMKKIGGYVTSLAAQVGKVERDIAQRKEKVEGAQGYMRTAAAAEKRGDTATANLQATFAAREVEFIKRRTASLKKMQQTLAILEEMEKRLDILYQDTDNQVIMLVDEYQAVKESYRAMKGASELINGDEAKALFDQTCQYVTDQVGMKLGEMDRFMKQAEGSLKTMDLKSDVLNDQGLELLANWKKDGVLSYEAGALQAGRVRIAEGTAPSIDELEADEMAQNAARSAGERPSSFSKIFNK